MTAEKTSKEESTPKSASKSVPKKSATPEEKGQESEEKVSFGKKVELKKHVAEREKNNDNFVILYPSDKGFYKAIGHSALFIFFIMGDQVSAKRKLLIDRDGYYESEIGVVSVKNLDSFARDAKKVGWKKFAPKDKHLKGCICYTFPKVEKERILELRHRAIDLKNEFNQIEEVETDYTNGKDFVLIEELLAHAAAAYRRQYKNKSYLQAPTYDIFLMPCVELKNHYVELALEGRSRNLEWVIKKFDHLVSLSLRVMHSFAIFSAIDGTISHDSGMARYQKKSAELYERLRGFRAKAIADLDKKHQLSEDKRKMGLEKIKEKIREKQRES